MLHKVVISLLLLTISTWALAADLAREQRIRDQIKDALLVGEMIELSAGDISFSAILTEADREQVYGTAIILHGMGANPDWLNVIHPLRTQLPQHGWETLSLQLPIASDEATAEEYYALIPEAQPRIDAAVTFLKKRGAKNLVLIGHSLGARMGTEYLANKPAQEIKALVAVGLSADRQQRDSGSLGALKKISLPTLDIFGSRDLPSVLESQRDRRTAARQASNTAYRQIEVKGADHFFNGLEDDLVQRVRSWIQKTIK